MKLAVIFIAVLVCVALVLLAALSCAAKPPQTGLRGGRLRPCPGKPNCVSSESAEGGGSIEPLRFQGSPSDAWTELQSVVRQMGGEIADRSDEYLWATFATRIFRFIDDVEFRMVAEERVIHVRSASRTGYYDLGVNSKRVEELRRKFRASQDQNQPGSPGGVNGAGRTHPAQEQLSDPPHQNSEKEA